METINVHLYRTEIPALTSRTPAPGTVPGAILGTQQKAGTPICCGTNTISAQVQDSYTPNSGPDPKLGVSSGFRSHCVTKAKLQFPRSVFSIKERARPGSLRSFLALKFVVYPQKLVTRSCGMNSTDLFLKK